MTLITLLVLLLTLPFPALALELESSAQRAQLIELYTSEGCSSCPPADRWLSAYLEDERLWRTVIPVAFHVDYWDYIGWQDPFAEPRFAARQRAYRTHGHLSSVYTPGFVVEGQEWRRWFVSRSRPEPALAQAAVLRLSAGQGRFRAAFEGRADVLHIVWLGFGVPSSVTAGENSGSEFTHDFVVLAHRRYAGESSWSGALPQRPAPDQARALVAWVSAGEDPTPLQAVGGWYD